MSQFPTLIIKQFKYFNFFTNFFNSEFSHITCHEILRILDIGQTYIELQIQFPRRDISVSRKMFFFLISRKLILLFLSNSLVDVYLYNIIMDEIVFKVLISDWSSFRYTLPPVVLKIHNQFWTDFFYFLFKHIFSSGNTISFLVCSFIERQINFQWRFQ